MEDAFTFFKILGTGAIWLVGYLLVSGMFPTSDRPYKGHEAQDKAVVIWAILCIIGGIVWIAN